MAKSAYPKSGGVVNGNVDATGYVSGKGVYEVPGIRVYSAVNKPSPGEIGAYTTGECDGRFQLKGSGLLSIDSDNARFNGHVLAWLDEVDRKYQPRGNYQPAGNYAVRGECYTKLDSDNRYVQRNQNYFTNSIRVWSGVPVWAEDGARFACSKPLNGRTVALRHDAPNHNDIYHIVIFPPTLGMRMHINTSAGYTVLVLVDADTIVALDGGGFKMREIYVLS
ncbi:hypothetical protein SAMN02982990_02376 [Photorhabdus luminescens]|uniref:Phage tail protein n=1 Tax=Photorhabdus luminescens TaxID=29488 RepID=A0A1G5QU44_PHOLU|nr:hypothetical protein SAMN02982990_02376 [Photorhabdus luminescens]